MLNDNDSIVSNHLKLAGVSVDENGKIKIDDEAILSIITGSAGEQANGNERSLWNGACSNAHCLLS